MNYTPEQLKGMSDFEIDQAVDQMLGGEDWFISPDDERNETSSWVYGAGHEATYELKSYCANWSATGPLMVEHRINMDITGDQWTATGYCHDTNDFIQVMDENPLRAICELLLKLNQE